MAAEVGPYVDCKCGIDVETRNMLEATPAQVVPLYALEKEGGFKKGDARGLAFTTARLAAGATALRNMSVDAQHRATIASCCIFVTARFLAAGNSWALST